MILFANGGDKFSQLNFQHFDPLFFGVFCTKGFGMARRTPMFRKKPLVALDVGICVCVYWGIQRIV